MFSLGVAISGTSLRSTEPVMTSCMRTSRSLDTPEILIARFLRSELVARMAEVTLGEGEDLGGNN